MPANGFPVALTFMISVPEAVDFVVLSGSRIALGGLAEENALEPGLCVFSSEGQDGPKSRLLVLFHIPYGIKNGTASSRTACLFTHCFRPYRHAGRGTPLFLIHTFIRLPHHIHDVHVPLGPHLPKRQGFGIRFIGLPLERGDLRIKDPLRNVRAEEDKFVSANTEKIVSPE